MSLLCFFIYSGINVPAQPLYGYCSLIVLSLISLFGTRQAQSYEYKQKDLTAAYEKKLSRYIYPYGEAMQRSEGTCGSIMQELVSGVRGSLIEESAKLAGKNPGQIFRFRRCERFRPFPAGRIASLHLIYAVSAGQITIPEFTLYFGAVTAFSGFVNGIVNNLNELNGANLQMNSMRAFLDNTNDPEPETPWHFRN